MRELAESPAVEQAHYRTSNFMKETSQKKCPYCSSTHVNSADAVGFDMGYWHPPEDKPENLFYPVYNCRNCATKFQYTGG